GLEAAQPGAGGAGGDAHAVVLHGHGGLVDGDGGGRGAGVAHDVGDPLADDVAEQLGEVVGQRRQGRGDLGLDADGGQHRAGRGGLGGGAHVLHAAGGGAHVGERLAHRGLDVHQLLAGGARVGLQQPAGQLGGDGQGGQRVAEQVVEVAADALALRGDG